MRSYIIPACLAVLLHAGLGVLFVDVWGEEPPKVVKKPEHINATIVDLEALVAKRRAIEQAKVDAERKKQAEINRKKAAEEKRKADLAKKAAAKKQAEKKAKQAAEAKKQAAAAAEKKRIAKLKADALAKKEAEKQQKLQQEQEKKRAEAEKQAQAAEARRLEAEQKEAERLARIAEQQAIIDAELAAEEALLNELEEEQVISSYTSYIRDLIKQNWRRSPNARNGMMVEVGIRLLPTGYVDDAFIVRSSGDDRFDRDAINAVLRVERFPDLQTIDPVLFDKTFRAFKLQFRPEDLRN